MNLLLVAGSLAGVIALWLAARWLGLGGDARTESVEQVRALAEAEGFAPTDIAVDKGCIAALARDANGRHLLLRHHGVHFVARILQPPIDARLDKSFLAIDRTTLDLGDDAGRWAASLRRIG